MKKIAVIGAGNWGKNHVKTFYNLGALKTVAEMSEPLRQKMKETYREIEVTEDYRKVLKDREITGVVIATPVATHFSLAKEALLAGKDVLVEKPMTASVSEAEELKEIARSHQRILMVGHLLLYQDAIHWMKQYIREGHIGQLISLHQKRLKLGRVRSFENVLWSFGVHDVAVMLYLIGKHPKSLHTIGQRVIQKQIEDEVHLHLSFEENVQAHLHVSWLWPEQERRLTVIGTQGMLVYDELAQTVIYHNKGIKNDLSNRDEGSQIVYKGNQEPLKNECQHFLDCIEERKQPLSDGENGLAVIQVLDQAMKSLK